jgi:hypothetical protein
MSRFTKRQALVLTLIILGTLLYGFTAGQHIYVESKEFSSSLHSPMAPSPSPSAEIVGIWEDEAEPGHKLEFSATGEIKIYSENIVEVISTYEISNTCDGETIDDGEYLKIKDTYDNSDLCYYINGINEDDSNILSVMNDQGQTEVYLKQ